MCASCRILHDPIVFRNLMWWGNTHHRWAVFASTRVYVHEAADGWIFLRSYLGFYYVRTGFDECIYDTSIIEVVDIPCRNSPYYVAYMLLPICAQFCYANGDSPYAKFPASLPVRIWGVPVCIRGSDSGVSAIFPPVTRWSRILCTHRAHSHQKPSLYHIISIASHSSFAFGDISHSLSICDIVRFYHFTLWTLNRQPYQIWEVCQLFPHSRKLPKCIPLNRKMLSWILG